MSETNKMVEEYLFPYERISHGSRVVIYGAGRVGKSFLRQLLRTGYADVLCLMDRRLEGNDKLIAPVVCPQTLPDGDYDYLIIAIEDIIVANSIRRELIEKYAIKSEKIILGSQRALSNMPNIYRQSGGLPKAKLNIAFFLPGGLGDCIIAKKFILSFMELFSGIPREVYIFANSIRAGFIPLLFGNDNFHLQDGGVEVYKEVASDYDISLYVGYTLRFDSFYEERLSTLAKSVIKKLKIMYKRVSDYGLDPEKVTDNGLHFARCKFYERNAYTAYEYSGIIKINDWRISIPLPESVDEKCQIKEKYITVNGDWGRSDIVSCKQWQREKWERLLKLFRSNYKDIKIVQLGGKNALPLYSADICALGKSWEDVLYLLKNSLLHVDIEGGLVHLASQLGTKCLVLFGHTPLWYFGYKENDNIQAGDCHDCSHLNTEYYRCIKNLDNPDCMMAITPELVMEHIMKILDND